VTGATAGILTSAAVVVGEKVLMDLAGVCVMSEWSELTWDDAMQRGYEALSEGEALYEEIDAEQGRSNIDIEKHLRRAELKVAQANAWLAMARELAWQRDDYGGRATR
jgi:predicted transcriptional regulator